MKTIIVILTSLACLLVISSCHNLASGPIKTRPPYVSILLKEDLTFGKGGYFHSSIIVPTARYIPKAEDPFYYLYLPSNEEKFELNGLKISGGLYVVKKKPNTIRLTYNPPGAGELTRWMPSPYQITKEQQRIYLEFIK